MNNPYLVSESSLTNRINDYFTFIEGEYHLENKTGNESKDQPAPTKKIWDRDPEPATFAGFAVHLGFSSLQALDAYIEAGKYNETLKFGHLRVEASYERKLHAQSATGAIFALKNRGWNERSEVKQQTAEFPKTLPVEVLVTGPIPAQSEKEVVL
jgi:hypothetical protein